ncbi:MAG: hypothetical protein H6810_02120 [Phycisphaeraceae bacterium]|nr:MAG: hypothetical protein H6810_02120 [Phycisphaeraceae bacterium]
MHRNTAIACALIAAAGAAAPAGIFNWTGGHNGLWNVDTNWSGPVGLYPSLTTDSATVSGNLASVNLEANTSLGLLNVLDGAIVYSAGHSLFINGDANIIGIGSSLSIGDTPALRDLDVDTLNIQAGVLAMYGGLAQIDENVAVGTSGGILGVGTVEMNSTTGNLVIQSGALWAVAGSGPGTTLAVTRTGTSTSKLDWTGANADILVWDGKTVDIQIPYTGPLGGDISVSSYGGNSEFHSTEGFIAGASSRLRFTGEPSHLGKIIAPFIDSYGEVSVGGNGSIVSPLVALRGTGTIKADCFLNMASQGIIFNSFVMTADGDNTEIQFQGTSGAAMSVTGGVTVFDLGPTGTFDLDGIAPQDVNIASGSSLVLNVGRIDNAVTEEFNGTLNIDGLLHVENYLQGPWANGGEIVLDGGSITGRALDNNGVITGHGSVESWVYNNGEIIADGGALVFDHLDLDGHDAPEVGVVRAQSGDVSITSPASDTIFPFTGSMFIGNGVGVREVVEMNFPISFREQDGVRASLELDGGFLRAKRVDFWGDLDVTEDSQVRSSGGGPVDRIAFDTGSVSTIDATLEVDGETWTTPGATFAGQGLLKGVSTVKTFYFQDGTNTSGVSVEAAGPINVIGNLFQAGEASVGGLTMKPTASLGVDLGSTEGEGWFDRYHAANTAHLDGTLVVNWTGNGNAPLGENYTVVTAGSVEGSFNAVDFSGLGVNRRAIVTVAADHVDVMVTCVADLNGDGLLDLNDVTGFIDAFTSNNPLADVAAPFGVFDLNDVTTFVSLFQSGCN